MPLVNTKEMFKKAYAGGYAVGAFNVNNMEIIQGITEGAKLENAPLVLQVSAGARKYAKHVYLMKMIQAALEDTDLPIAVHLDHGPDFETCKSCIDGGFTSVMIDGSHHTFAENIEVTKRVVEYAHSQSRYVTVEAELGRLAGVEDDVNVSAEDSSYTHPDEVEEFVKRTGCDSLAIAIGTSHGAFKFAGEPMLRFDILEEVSKRLIWAWHYPLTINYRAYGAFINPGVFANGTTGWSGECPTQNTVDRFETKWGDPLNSEAERNAATALGHYNEQDPYKDRDPRFYIDILYNTASLVGYGNAKIYSETVNGVTTYPGPDNLINPSYAGITRTGYYTRKTWGEQSVNNQISASYTDPLMRLSELYLNYAEAANEAYGPNTPAPGASLSAVQAINLIRNRIGMSDVQSQFTGSKEVFRDRIKNERFVELCLEGGHYFHDIRRWLDAPQIYSGKIMGISAEKVPVSDTYPTGFKYTRAPLEATRQCLWKDYMWYFPFNDADNYKMKIFEPNPTWSN